MVFSQEELRAVSHSVTVRWRPGQTRPPTRYWSCLGLFGSALACSGCASLLGAATLPVVNAGPGTSAQTHFVQRLPLPWVYWFSSGSSLAGQDSAAPGPPMILEGSSGTWHWRVSGAAETLALSADTPCEVAPKLAPAPPNTVDCALSRLHQFVQSAYVDAPGLDLKLDYVPNGYAVRLAWMRFSFSAIPLHFASHGAPYRDEKHRQRSLVEMAQTIGHELVHAYVALGYRPTFENKLAEETGAYAFEACAGLTIGGAEFAMSPKKGVLTGLASASPWDISWQASNNLDKLIAQALPKDDGQSTEQERAEAVLSVCRSIFPGLAAT
jgi:hypothetical protein